jgi:hypothetical protein
MDVDDIFDNECQRISGTVEPYSSEKKLTIFRFGIYEMPIISIDAYIGKEMFDRIVTDRALNSDFHSYLTNKIIKIMDNILSILLLKRRDSNDAKSIPSIDTLITLREILMYNIYEPQREAEEGSSTTPEQVAHLKMFIEDANCADATRADATHADANCAILSLNRNHLGIEYAKNALEDISNDNIANLIELYDYLLYNVHDKRGDITWDISAMSIHIHNRILLHDNDQLDNDRSYGIYPFRLYIAE